MGTVPRVGGEGGDVRYKDDKIIKTPKVDYMDNA
jgi:hypothetical protein